MARLRNFLLKIMPRAWAEAAVADSKVTYAICTTCGTERTVWDMGGLRWNASRSNKRVGTWCPTCRTLRSHRFEKRT